MQGGLKTLVYPATPAGGPDELEELAKTREAREKARAYLKVRKLVADKFRRDG